MGKTSFERLNKCTTRTSVGCSLCYGKGKSPILRYLSTTIYFTVLSVTIVLSGLAGPGKGPFSQSTGEVSDKNEICITPKDYTFSIWGLIYFLLFFIAIYAITILFLKVGFDKAWQLGGAVSVPFLLVLSLNLSIHVGWLFAWDLNEMIPSFVLLLLVAVTNTVALYLAAYSFNKAAPRLLTTSKRHFWMGTIVLNSHAIYNTWTTITAFINLGIMIVDLFKKSEGGRPIEEVENDVCTAILSCLLILLIINFILEQTILKRITNFLFTHYLVWIWTFVGIYMKNNDNDSAIVKDLIISNFSIPCIFLVIRGIFLYFRNAGYSMYKTI